MRPLALAHLYHRDQLLRHRLGRPDGGRCEQSAKRAESAKERVGCISILLLLVILGELAARLQEASVKIISRNTCNKLYDDAVTPRMLCAGNLQGGVDACQVSPRAS